MCTPAYRSIHETMINDQSTHPRARPDFPIPMPRLATYRYEITSHAHGVLIVQKVQTEVLFALLSNQHKLLTNWR